MLEHDKELKKLWRKAPKTTDEFGNIEIPLDDPFVKALTERASQAGEWLRGITEPIVVGVDEDTKPDLTGEQQ